MPNCIILSFKISLYNSGITGKIGNRMFFAKTLKTEIQSKNKLWTAVKKQTNDQKQIMCCIVNWEIAITSFNFYFFLFFFSQSFLTPSFIFLVSVLIYLLIINSNTHMVNFCLDNFVQINSGNVKRKCFFLSQSRDIELSSKIIFFG